MESELKFPLKKAHYQWHMLLQRRINKQKKKQNSVQAITQNVFISLKKNYKKRTCLSFPISFL